MLNNLSNMDYVLISSVLFVITGVIFFALSLKKKGAHKAFEEILDKKLGTLHQGQSEYLKLTLDPFKERIKEFQEKIEHYRLEEIKESSSLKTELKMIFELNQSLSEEAKNLTSALKGDNRLQGAWGEMILEGILDRSGLREGKEYVTQGRNLKLKNEYNSHQKPDVLIRLPKERFIIIDSKVSLKSFEKYHSTADECEKKKYFDSLKNHIKSLSEKKYHEISELKTLDFVLLFIPLESAFALALGEDESLYEYAWKRKIILVSPTTLFVTLKTIEATWRVEKQDKNAKEIAFEANALSEKILSFHEDLKKLEAQIDQISKSKDAMLSKLTSGKGHALSRIEKIKNLSGEDFRVDT